MIIEFGLSHVFSPGSNSVEDAIVLETLLNCMVVRNLAYLQHHAAPELYRSRVVYGRTNVWEDIGQVLKRGYGDCKSLSPWRIAELIHKKVFRLPPKPVFRYDYRPDGSGIRDFHILIQTPKGWECPSRTLGMGRIDASGGQFFRG